MCCFTGGLADKGYAQFRPVTGYSVEVFVLRALRRFGDRAAAWLRKPSEPAGRLLPHCGPVTRVTGTAGTAPGEDRRRRARRPRHAARSTFCAGPISARAGSGGRYHRAWQDHLQRHLWPDRARRCRRIRRAAAPNHAAGDARLACYKDTGRGRMSSRQRWHTQK